MLYIGLKALLQIVECSLNSLTDVVFAVCCEFANSSYYTSTTSYQHISSGYHAKFLFLYLMKAFLGHRAAEYSPYPLSYFHLTSMCTQ